MSKETPTMLDAMNEALAPLIPTAESETLAAEPVEPQEPEADAETETTAEAAPETDVAADPAASEAVPDGDKKPEGEVAPEAAVKPDIEKPVVEKKPLDPINDPIPSTVSERTRERITSLIGTVKDLTTAKAQGDELFAAITSTGASADELASMLSYMRLVHSPDIEDRRRAYEVVMSELRGLAPAVGEVLPGEDPLKGHQDLIDAVAALSLSPEHAQELALSRSRATARTVNTEQLNTQNRAAQEAETARLAGVRDLNALEADLRSDPDYARKYATLVPTLKPLFAQLHPSKWKQAFELAYKNLPVAAAVLPAAKSAVVPIKPSGQPLRPNKQPSGEGQRQPTTMLEAMNAGLAQLKG